MLRIWKYQLSHTEHPIVKLPKNAKILDFRFLNKVPCIWAFVNVENPEEERKFWLVEAGQAMNIDPHYLYFIGSDLYMTDAGPYIAYLFEFVTKGRGNMSNIV
jgi:hypothetical protein